MLAAMAFIKLAGNIQRTPAIITDKFQQQSRILSGPQTPASMFVSVMQQLVEKQQIAENVVTDENRFVLLESAFHSVRQLR